MPDPLSVAVRSHSYRSRMAGKGHEADWKHPRRELRDWGVIAFAGYITVAFAVGGFAAFYFLPDHLAHVEDIKNAANKAKAVNDARAAVLQSLAGLVVFGRCLSHCPRCAPESCQPHQRPVQSGC